MNSLGILPNYIDGLVAMIVQSYKGDVTIVPSPTFQDYKVVFGNVTVE